MRRQDNTPNNTQNPSESPDFSDSRRRFISQSAAVCGGLLVLGAAPSVLATTSTGAAVAAPASVFTANIETRGYAAFDATGVLKPWVFERRPVGDNDILIDVKAASICHSDIHQMKGHWGPQQYPQVPGHEIAGVVTAVGKNVTRFKVGDRAGVGCMVDGCTDCSADQHNGEQYRPDTVFTYGYPHKKEPTGISQGGYSNKIVVNGHFAVHLPDSLTFEQAAPLLCAGVTTWSPLLKFDIKPGMKVGVAGIGGLGHLAVKLAVSKGADVIAFTTSPDKVKDIVGFGAKDVVVVDDLAKLGQYAGQLDCLINTLPVNYNVAAYAATVKPFGTYTQVGMPEKFEVTMPALGLAFTRVNFNASLIGDIKETQDVVNYCAEHKIVPEFKVISADQINQAWADVVAKKARYRYVIDAKTFG